MHTRVLRKHSEIAGSGICWENSESTWLVFTEQAKRQQRRDSFIIPGDHHSKRELKCAGNTGEFKPLHFVTFAFCLWSPFERSEAHGTIGRTYSNVVGTDHLVVVLTCFGCETKNGVVRILVIFQDRPMFSHIIQKVSARAFH